MSKLKPRYYGEESKLFWDIVNGLPDRAKDELYSLGCALQDLEGRVLKTLERVRPNIVEHAGLGFPPDSPALTILEEQKIERQIEQANDDEA